MFCFHESALKVGTAIACALVTTILSCGVAKDADRISPVIPAVAAIEVENSVASFEQKLAELVLEKLEREPQDRSVRRVGQWAFVTGVPPKAYKGQGDDHVGDTLFFALARKREDGWHIEELDHGSSDVSFLEWADKHDLPVGLLPAQDISDW